MSEHDVSDAERLRGSVSESALQQFSEDEKERPAASHSSKQLTRCSTNPHQRAQQAVKYNKTLERRENAAEEVQQAASHQSLEPVTEELVGPVVHHDAPESRQINVNRDFDPNKRKPKFCGNSITTSKYNVVTFLPIFLFEMFSRVAYLYFLAQASLSWWEEVSPFSGVGATMALLFVLLVSGVKSIAEDLKRHHQDDITNNSDTKIIQEDGTEAPVKWKQVKVGDIIKVYDDELFPADILCLKTGLRDRVCFIRTTNLDGESNLKIRKPVDIEAAQQGRESTVSMPNEDPEQEIDPAEERFIFEDHVQLECEVPNGNLHKFRGRLHLFRGPEHDCQSNTSIPITMSEMLLRGTLLKNSNYVIGLVVYTGKETRIQKNAARVPLKVGSFDRFLNIQIAILISVQALLCIFLAIGSYSWRENQGKDRYQLALDVYVQGNYEDGFIYVSLTFITFWILTSYMVPISLFVTMEIVKFWQAFMFINNDPYMTNEENPDEHALARNSNLNEDLGKVQYIFSDKTGTLTSNDMQLRMVNIKGITYGNPEFKLEKCLANERGFSALQEFDGRMARSVDLLQRNGFWEDLLDCGGSREYILSMPASDPSLESMGSFDRRTLQSELNEHKGKKREHKDVRSSLGSIIAGGARLIRSMSAYTDSGAMITIDNKYVSDYVFGWHMVDFWTNICLCHSLIIEEREAADGTIEKIYQGPSPDEVALVEAGRNVGFVFRERTKDGILLDMQGHEVHFELLNVLEFNSDRKRMSVIAKCSDGTLRVFCKGADNVMLKLLKSDLDPDLIRSTEQSLYDFSVKGLRTLVLGTRLLEQKEYEAWDARYQSAARSLSEDREAQINAIAEELEQNFELVGLTAIEDKLQTGVPHAIETLRLAGMKVWMITGDKMETAINIGISCNLITSQDVLRLTADDPEEAQLALRKLHDEANLLLESNDKKVELVVDGPSLVHILGTPWENSLSELGAKCSGVVVCRSSPSQKAAIVKIMTDYEQRLVTSKKFFGRKAPFFVKMWRAENRRIQSKALGIGDGANDVAMIQAADVGVGIAGKEGRQAVNNSDYALTEFRHLIRLLLVHGQLSHYRLARLIKYSFFKNIAFAFVLIFYQIYCGFSGQSLIDDISAAMYNVVFTSMPILLFSLLDRPMGSAMLMRFPQVYNNSDSLSTAVFWKTGILQGLVDGAICFFIPFYSISPSGPEAIDGVWAVGKVIYIAILGAVTLEACLVARFWTGTFFLFVFLSYFLVYPFFLLFPYIERGLDIYDASQYGVAEDLFSTPVFWFIIFSVYALTFGIRYFNRCTKWLFRPDDNMILAEFEGKHGEFYDLREEERIRLQVLCVPNVPSADSGRDSERDLNPMA